MPEEAKSHLKKFEKAIGYSIIRQMALDDNEKKSLLNRYLRAPNESNNRFREKVKSIVKESALRNDFDQPMKSDGTKFP